MKKTTLLISIVAALTIAAVFIHPFLLGSRPFESLHPDEIASIELTVLPSGNTDSIESPEQIQNIVNSLNQIVIYEKNDTWGDQEGQYISFTLSMKSGKKIKVGTNNSFFTIGDQGYRTKYQAAQELSNLGNQLVSMAATPSFGKIDLENLIGLSQKQIAETLGKPLGSLSGLWGDIYPLNDQTLFTVYYDTDGFVNYIRSNNTIIPGTRSGVVMTIKAGTLTPSGATLIFTNNSDLEYTYGEAFVIQKKANDEWYDYTVAIDDYAFNDIGYILESMQTREMEIKWEWLYGELEPGEYRIIKDIIYVREPGDLDIYNLSSEFEIEN